MSKARLVITAVAIEGRTVAEVAATYGASRSWTYELLGRYRDEGDAAFEPPPRRPRTSPTTIPQSTVDLIIRRPKQLSQSGLDAGPDMIAWHLDHRQLIVSVSTIPRTLTRDGAGHQYSQSSWLRSKSQGRSTPASRSNART